MQTSNDETQLISHARAGDSDALTILFEGYRERLEKMVSLRMDPRVKARIGVSDVLQEAFVDLVKQLDNYAKNPQLPFYLWLRRITGQRLAKVHRAHLARKKRDVNREQSLDAFGMPDASAVFMAGQLAGQFTSASEKAIRNENAERMHCVIESLSDGDREILAMRHLEQLTNGEVAILLNVSEPAARSRYVRAIRHLRDALKE